MRKMRRENFAGFNESQKLYQRTVSLTMFTQDLKSGSGKIRW